MKSIKTTTFLIAFVLLFASCHDNNKPTESSANKANQDSVALTNLVRQMYQWHETGNQKVDFTPKTNNTSDTLYSGIDLELV